VEIPSNMTVGICRTGGSMKTGIISTFMVSVICFIFSYLAITRDETFLTLIFLGIGVILAGCGVYLTIMCRKETTGSDT
jgi:uncharacterized membrane protein YczE